MARNDFFKLAKKLDMVAASVVSFGPIRAAHRTIRELQEEGPSWSGRFSNSWQIETPDGRSFKGTGAPGEPRSINIPALTGRQAIRASFAKDRAVFTVSNFSPYAALATDVELGIFDRRETDTFEPETVKGMSTWEIEDSGRKRGGTYRGEIGGGNPMGESSRTAELDWFATYVEGGKVDRAVRIEMDDLFTEL